MFLDATAATTSPACINYDPSHFLLQAMDYLAFIDIYHDRISSFHVKDAEFNPDGRQGVYSGYQPWVNRAGRFRSPRRRAGGLLGHLLQAHPARLRRLGGAGMGVLPEVARAGRARGRALHRGAPDRAGREGLRRLRGRRARRRRRSGGCSGSEPPRPKVRREGPGGGGTAARSSAVARAAAQDLEPQALLAAPHRPVVVGAEQRLQQRARARAAAAFAPRPASRSGPPPPAPPARASRSPRPVKSPEGSSTSAATAAPPRSRGSSSAARRAASPWCGAPPPCPRRPAPPGSISSTPR